MMSSCDWKAKSIPALAFAAVGYIGSWAVWGLLFAEEAMKHAALWRPQGSPETAYIPLAVYIILGYAVACLYSKCCATMQPGECGKNKVWCFSLTLWFVALAISCLPKFAYLPISTTLLLAYMLDKAVTFLLGTYVLSLLWRNNGASGSCGMGGKPKS